MSNWIFILPLKKIFDEDGGASILDGLKIPHSSAPASGRLPSPREVRAAIASMPDLFVSHDHTGKLGWQLSVEDGEEGGLLLQCDRYSRNEDEPADFYFNGWSSELAVRIAAELSKVCGDFFLCTDWNCGLIVTPDTPGDAVWFCDIDEEEIHVPAEDDAADELEIASSLQAESLHAHLTD